MIATSLGLGPFLPAIRWYGRLWACSTVECATEDEACSIAEGVVLLLNARATEYVSQLGYMPVDERALSKLFDGSMS